MKKERENKNMDMSTLSKHDLDLITAIRNEASPVFITQNTKDWLIPWGMAKSQYLDKIFSNSLILEKEIDYQITEEELSEKVYKNLFHWHYGDENCRSFRDAFMQAFDYLRKGTSTHEYMQWCAVTSLMESFNLAINYYSGDNIEINLPNGQIFKLNHGMKTHRAIGKLASMLNIDGWEPVRIKISQILNTKRLKGKLHLSIHPADYLTASINEYNWTSCMNLWDGEYRRGVIEMMNSPCIVVGYLTGEDETMLIDNCECSNKKWREFFIVDKDLICGIKGYPYWNRNLEKACCDWLKELVITNNVFPDSKYTDNFENFFPYESNYNFHYEDKDIKFYFNPSCGPAMYNDFHRGSEFFGYINIYTPEAKMLDYSGFSECISCGNECYDYDNEDEESGNVTCYDCYHVTRCDNCGDPYDDADLTCINGRYYCPYCLEDLPICEYTDEKYDPDIEGITGYPIGFVKDNIKIIFDKRVYLNDDGITALCNPINTYYISNDYHYREYFLDYHDLNEKGRKFFDFPDTDEEFIKYMTETYGIMTSENYNN